MPSSSPLSFDPSKLHFEFPIPNRETLYKNLVLYISNACLNDPTYSKVKQLKIAFYSDFESFARRGKPITGMPYRKLPFGPAPSGYGRLWDEMQRDGEIRIANQPVFDLESQRIVPMKEANLEDLSGVEVAIVHRWIQFFWGKTARWVSKFSHGKAWELTNDGERIPYEAVFISDERVTIDDVDHAKELGRRYGWKI